MTYFWVTIGIEFGGLAVNKTIIFYIFECCKIHLLCDFRKGEKRPSVLTFITNRWRRGCSGLLTKLPCLCVTVGFTGFVCLVGSWSCHLCLALLKDKASIYQQNQNSTSEWHQSPLCCHPPTHHPPVKTQDRSVWSSMLCADVAESYGRSAPMYLTARVGGRGHYQLACKVFTTCYKNPLWT